MRALKKIIIVSPAHPLRGGIAASSERMAHEFLAHGYEVEIYSFSLQYPSFLFPGATQYTTDPAPKDLRIITRINSIQPFNWIAVRQEIKKKNPDLIIVRFWIPFLGPCLGTILRIAKRGSHTKVIALIDNALPHEKRPGDKAFTRYFLHAVDGCIAMSYSVKSDIERLSPGKPVHYNPHPIYDNYGELVDKISSRKFLTLNPEGRYILFFGFIRDYKGLDLLLKALAQPVLKTMDIKLIVAGEYYGKKDYYENLISELDIADRIYLFTNYIPAEEVKYFFGAADLVVQPYKSATQSGISQIAYHFEKPMVVTNVGGLPEIVPDGIAGFVTEVGEHAVAEAIVKFYEKALEQKFIEGVRSRKTLYSWKKLMHTFESLFQSL